MKIPQSVRDEIAKGPFAHLTTLNKDGSPQVTVVWVGIESEEFVIGHLALHQKIKNIRRDARVALYFIGRNTSKEGMRGRRRTPILGNRAHTREFRSILRDVRKVRDWMVERGEFELSVPICEQSDDSIRLSFATSRRTAK